MHVPLLFPLTLENVIMSPQLLSPKTAAPKTRGGHWLNTGTTAVPSRAGWALGVLREDQPQQRDPQNWEAGGILREEVGVLVSGCSREIRSFPDRLPSQRNSQSRARTIRWGMEGSEWSGCGRPSPWLAPHTPHTWKVPKQTLSAAEGMAQDKALTSLFFFPLFAVNLFTLSFWFDYTFVKWIMFPLPGL